jgi:hypothetical protein
MGIDCIPIDELGRASEFIHGCEQFGMGQRFALDDYCPASKILKPPKCRHAPPPNLNWPSLGPIARTEFWRWPHVSTVLRAQSYNSSALWLNGNSVTVVVWMKGAHLDATFPTAYWFAFVASSELRGRALRIVRLDSGRPGEGGALIMSRKVLVALTFALTAGLGMSSVFSQTPPNTTQLQPAKNLGFGRPDKRMLYVAGGGTPLRIPIQGRAK